METSDSTSRSSRPADVSHSWFSEIARIPGRVLILLVKIYQGVLSPVLGTHCRFEPSCSRYFIGAVEKYGVLRGTWRGIKRISRCHPWNEGGYDPP